MKIFKIKTRSICFLLLGVLWGNALMDYINKGEPGTLIIASMVIVGWLYENYKN